MYEKNMTSVALAKPNVNGERKGMARGWRGYGERGERGERFTSF